MRSGNNSDSYSDSDHNSSPNSNYLPSSSTKHLFPDKNKSGPKFEPRGNLFANSSQSSTKREQKLKRLPLFPTKTSQTPSESPESLQSLSDNSIKDESNPILSLTTTIKKNIKKRLKRSKIPKKTNFSKKVKFSLNF